MLVSYMLTRLWQWIADPGIPLAILFVIALLIPRVGRFIQRWLDNRLEASDNPDESKVRMAVAGVSVYIGEMVAYFLLLIALLQTIGFSLAGAAIPATVVSAAIGFGAQSIIADFLAGFFILSEKQFGVGDWVRFEGNGVTVEGTVIQVTMRATRIRTLAEETVIVPNSAARVSINTSNYWSRAVVVIPVPLLGSDSPREAIDRSEAATRRALERPDVASELLGELDVHPAVGVNPPTTVGMPWTVDMRFMIQVDAGSQWLVERAIRTSILDEFWDEYGSATTVTGELQDQVYTAPAPEHDTTAALRAAPRFDVPVGPAPTESTTTDAAETTDATEVFAAAETTALPGTPDRPETSTPPPGYSDEEGKDPAVVDKNLQVDQPDDEDGATASRREVPTTRWQKLTTLNGRTRPSTTYLFAALFLLLILRGMTLTTEDASGVLAPPVPAPETTVEPEPVPTPETVPPMPTTPTPEITTTPETPQGTQTPQSPGETWSPQETQTPQGTQTPQPQEPDQTAGPTPTAEPAPSPGTGGGGTTPQGGGPEAASTPGTGVDQPLN